MDNGQPLSLVLHFEYTPYNPVNETGWEPEEITNEVFDFVLRLLRNSSGLELRDLETLPHDYGRIPRARDQIAARLADAAERYGRTSPGAPNDEAVTTEFWDALRTYRELDA